MKEYFKKHFIFLLLITIQFGWAQSLPTGVTAIPFYNQNSINFNGNKLVGIEEVPGLAQHFYVLDLHGKIFSLYPDGSGGFVKNEIADFSDVTNSDAVGEAGAWKIAFHPEFLTNDKFYILYLKLRQGESDAWLGGGFITIEEWKASGSKKDQISKQREVLSVVHEKAYGAPTMTFGPDSMLYIVTNDYLTDSWDLTSFGRKVMRIDVNTDNGYNIPSDNPFYNDSDPKVKKEIWAFGFRNLWTLSHDPLTGTLWGGDVGQWYNEEINIVQKGKNYGWADNGDATPGGPFGVGFTGPCDPNPGQTTTSTSNFDCSKFEDPYYNFGRSGDLRVACIIVGRTFKGDKNSPFYGYQFLSDTYWGGLIALKEGETPQKVGEIPNNFSNNNHPHDGISAFGEDFYGNLYVTLVSLGSENRHIYKLEHNQLTERTAKWGCTNPLAPNFDSQATDDNGTCEAVGIKDFSLTNNGIIQVESGEEIIIRVRSRNNYKIMVFDMNGKLIFSDDESGTETDSDDFYSVVPPKSGMYLVMLELADGIRTKKAILY